MPMAPRESMGSLRPSIMEDRMRHRAENAYLDWRRDHFTDPPSHIMEALKWEDPRRAQQRRKQHASLADFLNPVRDRIRGIRRDTKNQFIADFLQNTEGPHSQETLGQLGQGMDFTPHNLSNMLRRAAMNDYRTFIRTGTDPGSRFSGQR